MKKCSFCGELIPDETVVCRWCGRKQNPAPTQTEEKKGHKPMEIFCYNCGTQLPDGANFCWKCGQPQKEGTQVEEPIWETCIITYEGTQESGWFGPGKARWWAKATGPKGNYRAGESKPFSAGVLKQEVDIPTVPSGEYYKTLEELVNRLLADGWEPTMPYGGVYWNLRFRRRIR